MLWQRGKAYSQDLRERVLAAADDGVSHRGLVACQCLVCFKSPEPTTPDRTDDGAATTLSDDPQTRGPACGDPGPGEPVPGCDAGGVTALAVSDAQGFGEQRPDVEDAEPA
jgi:hypothetical protein